MVGKTPNPRMNAETISAVKAGARALCQNDEIKKVTGSKNANRRGKPGACGRMRLREGQAIGPKNGPLWGHADCFFGRGNDGTVPVASRTASTIAVVATEKATDLRRISRSGIMSNSVARSLALVENIVVSLSDSISPLPVASQ